MEHLAPLLVVPFVICICAAIIFDTITWKEFFVQMGVVLVLVTAGFFICRAGAVIDTEVWSGRITGKEQVEVPCTHSHSQCIAWDEDGICTAWHTWYEHDHDYDWRAYTSNNETITIPRVDRQGVNPPPRWTRIQDGDPTAQAHGFINYIKGNKKKFFTKPQNYQKLEEKEMLPNYPKIRDDYFCDRFINVNVDMPGVEIWNMELMEINAFLGARKKVNIIMVAVMGQDREEYVRALDYKWLRGKKNDFIIVFGVNRYPKLEWVEIISWTDDENLKNQVRGELFEKTNLDNMQEILAIVRNQMINSKMYVRKKFKDDFRYLRKSIVPPTWALIMLYVLGIGGSLVLSIFFHRNDVFGDEGRFRRW